jgi:WD40 repeat protein
LAVLAAAVAVLAVWALGQRNTAQQRTADAHSEAANATSLALAASSVEPLTTRPDVSLGLAFEAYRKAPRPEARSAVIRALLAARQSRLRGVLTSPHLQNDVAFSPDGKTLASTSSDNTVRLWDPATRKPLAVLRGHTDMVYAVAFSPDGKTLAGASSDNTVRLWGPGARKPLGRITGHTNTVYAVAFSPDGKTLATASYDNTVRVWREVLGRNVAELRATVCDILLTGLTRSDWEQYASGTSYRRSCP